MELIPGCAVSPLPLSFVLGRDTEEADRGFVIDAQSIGQVTQGPTHPSP